ncbi:MAG: sulfotransferase [Rhizobiales bacterium]|nr:sulfotransferase [Hyphomicrobiales bacterium]
MQTRDKQLLIQEAEADFQAALAAQNAGDAGKAEAGYHRVLNRLPDNYSAIHNLAMLMTAKGQPGAAVALLLRAAALAPQSGEIQNTLGNAYRLVGDLAAAEASYRKALELRPGYAAPWFNLAAVARDRGRTEDMKACYRKTIELDPNHRDAHLNLGNLLRDSDRETAVRLTRRALEIDPNYALAHNNLANMLRDADRLEEAAAHYRRATELDPDYALAWLNLGTVLTHLGRAGESAAALRRSLALNPAMGDTYFQLAITEKLKLDDPAVEAARRLYADPRTPDSEKIYLAFALGRVFDQHNRFDEAFAFWETGNRLKRKAVPFDIANEKRIVAAIKKRYTPEFLARAPRSDITDDTPIFVVGMIRSGTTLMEQILASHPQVVGADEETWLPEASASAKRLTKEELNRAAQQYIGRLRERFGPKPRRIVDKLVGNWLEVGFIHLALPGAKIICMRRNPYDSGLSAYASLFTGYHEYCYDLRDIAIFYSLFRELMAHWDSVLPGKVLTQHYEELIAKPEESVRRILDFLDLPFDERCLNFHQTERRVKTASTQQVREKLHSRAIDRWRNYERHLKVWEPYFGPPG